MPELGTVQVKVFHSTERGYMFRAWTPEAPMKLVDTYDEEVRPHIVESVYRAHNAVDGTGRRGSRWRSWIRLLERCVKLRIRESVGWREIDPRELKVDE